jgi:transcriptional regulator with XRE-family HTH domain
MVEPGARSLGVDRRALARRLSDALATADGTQRELAKSVGVHPNLVSRWAGGRAVPSVEHLARLSNALDVSLDWLVLGAKPSGHSTATEPAVVLARELATQTLALRSLAEKVREVS